MAEEIGIGGVDPRSRTNGSHAVSPVRVALPEPTRSRTRIVIVSDVLLHREALTALLDRLSGVTVVGVASGPDEAVSRLRDEAGDVALLALGHDNVEAARKLLAAAPDARVCVIGAPERPEHVIELAEAGVLGFLTREQSLSELSSTIESVSCSELACPPWIATLLVRRVQALAADRPGPTNRLTAREAAIVELIAEGLSNREIGERLHIELTTVKNHVHNILEKLGARTRAEAVALAGVTDDALRWRRS
jgi:two-component system nitrate/nitrite response regulator NarL